MSIKVTTNSQLSTTESKKQKQINQTTRSGTESQIWTSVGGLSAGRWKGKNGGTGTGINKHNWQVQNRQEDVNKSIGNGEAKELTCMTHGHELRRTDGWRERGTRWRRSKGKNWGNCNAIKKKIYLKTFQVRIFKVSPGFFTPPVLKEQDRII